MGELNPPPKALLLIAAFSRYPEALDWTQNWACERFGPVALRSPRFDFTETDYYEALMGDGLIKQFWAFEQLMDPACLADLKNASNQAESAYRDVSQFRQPRPLNIDPGYMTLSKLVLASTKNHAHRIYLRDGIFAEITLRYRQRCWQPWEWTYPDYRRPDFAAFFEECRACLDARLRHARGMPDAGKTG